MTLPVPENQHYAVTFRLHTNQTNKQTNYLFAWKTILRLFVVCVLLRMTLLVLENQPYVIFFDYTTNKNICFAWKTVYTRAGRALVRGVDGSPGGWSLTVVARGQRPLA